MHIRLTFSQSRLTWRLAALLALLVAALMFTSLKVIAQSPPAAPTNLTATHNGGTVDASWDAVSGATKYHVTYSFNNKTSWVAASCADNCATNSYTVIAADSAKTYIVAVRAGNADGWSSWVNSAPAAPSNPPPTTAPLLASELVTTSVSEITISEGHSAEYQLKLGSQPPGNVIVMQAVLSKSQDRDDVAVSPQFLNFDRSNWDTYQTVAVSAYQDDDSIDDSAVIGHEALNSSYQSYGQVTEVSVTVTDDDPALAPTPTPTATPTPEPPRSPAGLVIATPPDSALDDIEGIRVPKGGQASFTVRLATQPTDDVPLDITLVYNRHGSLTSSPSSMMFTTADWDRPQTVTVRSAAWGNNSNAVLRLNTGYTEDDAYYFLRWIDYRVREYDAPGIVLHPNPASVAEGSTTTYGVRLNTKPTADVSVTVAEGTGDSDITVTSSKTLNFTAADWKNSQYVTLSAAHDDDLVNGSRAIIHTASSSGDYAGLAATLTATEADDETAALLLSTNAVTVPEGGSASYTVRLSAQPSSAATVSVSAGTSEDGDITVAPTSLSFNTSNWNSAQTVTVSAGEDDDGVNGSSTIRHTASGAEFDGLTATVSATESDNDAPGITVSPPPGSISIAEGGSYSYTVVLDAAPTAEVSIAVSASGDDDIRIQNAPLTLGFTAADWSTPKRITILADEDTDAANGTATVSHAITTTDSDYAEMSIGDITATERDNELGVTLSTNALTVPEGSTANYTVRLSAQPTGDVTVVIAEGAGDANITVSSPSNKTLTFTSSTYSTAQTVTLSAAADPDSVDGSRTIAHTANGGGYGNITAALTATENDNTPTLTASGATATTVTLTIGNYSGQWRYKHTGQGATCSAAQTGTTANATGLSVNTQYTFKAYSDSSCSDELATASAFTTTNPSLASSSVTHNSATLTLSGWVAGTGSGKDGNWRYKYTSPTGGTCSAAQSGQTASVSNLTGNTAYTFTAYSDSACSNAISAAHSFTTQAAPTLTAGTPTATTVTLTIANHAGDWRYKYTSPTGGTCSAAQTGTTANATGLSVNTQYTFKAYSDSSCSDELATASAFTTTNPSLASSSVTHNSATLTLSGWVAGTGSGKDGDWRYKYTSPIGGTCSAAQSGQTASVSNLTGNTAYTFTAYSDVACSNAISAAHSFTTQAAPTLTASGATATTVTLTIANHAGDWRYKYTSPTGGTCSAAQTGTTANLTGLTKNTTYTFKAYSDSSCSDELATASAFTTTNPSLASSSVTHNSATLTLSGWVAGTGSGKDGNWRYKYTSPTGGTCSAAQSGQTASVSNLTGNTAYTFTAYSDSACATSLATASAFTTPGIVLTPTAQTVTEGSTATYTVKLSAAPTSDVTITVAAATTGSNTDADITVKDTDDSTSGDQTTAITFTSQNWNTARTVTLAAAEDDSDVANGKRDITHTAASADATYSGATATLTATEADNDHSIVLTPATLDITEGGTATYTVKLNIAPTQDVTITIAAATDDVQDTDITIKDTDDNTNGDQTGTITFTSANYSTARTVTLAAAADTDTTNGTREITHTAASTDTNYSSESVTLTATESDTTPALTVTNITATGATLTITKHTTAWYYKSATAGATTCTSVAANTASTAVSGLTPATEYTFTAHSDSACTTGNKLATASAFTTPGIVLTPTTQTVTEGSTATYTVKLATQPTQNVSVAIAAATTGSNTDADITVKDTDDSTSGDQTTAITFTSATWNTARTVTLAAAEDDSDAANGKRDITHTATSTDTTYSGATATLTATEADNDHGIVLTPATLDITEGGTATYTVKLNIAPTQDVTVTIAAATTGSNTDASITVKDTDDSQSGDQTGTITFTSTTWNTARTVTLAAASDTDLTNGTRDITHTAASSDTNYSGATATLTATESDTTIALTASSITGTSATLTIANHTTAWWYKSATTGATTCTAVAANTASTTVSGLMPGVSYTFTAFGDSACTPGGGGGGGLATATAFNTVGVSVSNLTEAGSSPSTMTLTRRWAAPFTTGSNPSGYTLHSAILRLQRSAVTVTANWTIQTSMTSGSDVIPTDTVVATLSNGTVTTAYTNVINACTESQSNSCALSPNTTYFVVGTLTGSGSPQVLWNYTTSANETLIPSGNGWSIGSKAWYSDYSNSSGAWGNWATYATNNSPDVTKFQISAIANPTLSVTSVTVNSATLNIADHSGAWWYKRTAGTPASTTCHSVASGTTSDSITGLTAGNSYTYKAYDASGCASANEIATLTFSTTPGIILTPTTQTVTEGSTATYTVKLATQPTQNVSVAIAAATTGSNTDADITVKDTDDSASGDQTTAITFTSATWNTARTVTLAAAEDDSDAANGKRDITHTATSTDTTYSGATATLTATEADNDHGIVLTPASLSVTEGGTATYTVKLNIAPTQDVTVTIAAATTGSNTDASITVKDTDDSQSGDQTGTITFTSTTWNTARTVTLAAASDTDTTNGTRDITHTAASSDTNYSGATATLTATESDTTPTLTATNITTTGATLTITKHTTAWYYKSATAGATTCTSVAANTASTTVSGLTPLTAYTFTAYSDSTCATSLASASAFTTPGIVLTPTTQTVTEGSTATYTVKLSAAPTSDVTITVAAATTGSNTDGSITVKDTDDSTSGDQTTAIVFNSTNYNTARTVTLAAASDTDLTNGKRDITHTAASSDATYSGATATLTATESDTTPTLTATNIATTSATLTIAHHTTAWWYKSTTTGKTACTSVAANTASTTVSGLTPLTAYTFTAYSDSACAISLATASAFTTPGIVLTPTTQTVTEGSTATYTVKLSAAPTSDVTITVAAATTGSNTDASITVKDTDDSTNGDQTTSIVFNSTNYNTARTVILAAASDTDTTDGKRDIAHTAASSDATYSGATATLTATESDTTPTLTTTNITATGARLTIGNHAAAWWYKADTGPHNTCQGPVNAGTSYVDLTGLTEHQQYTYTAYSATGCSSGNSLVSHTFEPSGDSLQVTNVTPTTATLQLIGHTGNWWFKKTAPETGTCTAGNSNFTNNLTGLTAGTEYTYKAYDVSGCGATHESASITFSTPGIVLTPTTQTVTEGSTATYTVKLSRAPSANVSIAVAAATTGTNTDDSITVKDTDDSTSGDQTTAITFTSTTWNTARTVILAAASDTDSTSDSRDITHTATSTDSNYSGATATLTATESDTTIALTASSITGTSATLTIANHTTAWWYKSTTTGKTTCTSVAANTASTNVTGLTAATAYTFTAYSNSGCTTTLAAAAAFYTPGIILTPTTQTITEGSTATYTIKLATQPTANVTVSVAAATTGTNTDASITVKDTDDSTNGDQTTAITFTGTTWSTARTITLAAAADTDATSGKRDIKHTASSADGDYSGITATLTATESDTTTQSLTASSITKTGA